jgi:predicted secreted hydrolase
MVTGTVHRLSSVLAAALTLSAMAGSATFSYRQAVPSYRYQFPQDHFEHPDFRTEWWYYTGNVTDAAGRRFGFELVFFRQGERHAETNRSEWSVQQLYLAHAALTDAAGKHFWYDERLNRPGPGIAGVSLAERRVWNGNWSLQWNADDQTIEATTRNFRFQFALHPEKPLVFHGKNGVEENGPGRTSFYLSFPLLKASGTVTVSGVTRAVHGTAWMDHQWFTNELSDNQVGWDWFSIQLDNDTELMLFQLRRKDGSADPYSSGTYIDAKGTSHPLRSFDFSLQPLARWGAYPIRWRIRIPSLKVDLTCTAVMDNQELRSNSEGPSYWEGAVDYSGSARGVGYLEMTGYGAAVKL